MSEIHQDEEWLREQYWGKDKSRAEVAEVAGVTDSTIRYWMDKHGIETRSKAEANAEGDISKLQNRKWLYTEYIENERSTIDIAEELDLANDTVLKWLNNHDIEPRSRSEARTDGDVTKLHDKEWLRTEYVEEMRTGPDIAAEVGVDSMTVYIWLDKHDIEVRDQGISRTNGATKKLRDKDWLEEKYTTEMLSMADIGELCGCSSNAVENWLHRHNIETRAGGRDMSDGDLESLNNPIYLQREHWVEHKSTTQIAEDLNVHPASVCRKMNEFNIETRGQMSNSADYDKLDDLEYLHRQYVEEEKSLNQIAEDCGCSRHAVSQRMKRLDVEIVQHRDHYFTRGLEFSKSQTDGDIAKLYDEEYVKRQYVENEKSMVGMAQELNLSAGAVINALRRYDIEARDYPEAAPKGREHPNHKNFDTGYYGPNWEEQKLSARIRDHCKCQVCGINDAQHLDKYNRVNSVHHITPRSYYVDENGVLDYETANRLDNLITLCSDHHPDYEGVPIDNRTSR